MVREITVVQARLLAAAAPWRRFCVPRKATAGDLGAGAASPRVSPATDEPANS